MPDSCSHLLEGDGIVSNLYYFIWKKKITAVSGGTDLSIPSTVVFEHNFPKAWYYLSEKTGDIERKLGKDVDSTHMFHEFAPGSRKGGAGLDDVGDVVATYFSTVELENGKPATRVEFLDRAGLKEFLFRRSRRPDGFLQKWVPATGKSNTVVQAIWSPHLCIIGKRQNLLALRDKRFPIYERAVTYDGPTHYSREVFVAPHIKWQVKSICQELVDHLHATEHVSVQRMVLYFKVDHKCDIWLLWCSSMRISGRTQLCLAPPYVHTVGNEEEEERKSAIGMASLLQSSNQAPEPVGLTPKKPSGAPSDRNPFHGIREPRLGPLGDLYGSTTPRRGRSPRRTKTPREPPMFSLAQYTTSPGGVAPSPPTQPKPPPRKRKLRKKKRAGAEEAATHTADVPKPPPSSLHGVSAAKHARRKRNLSSIQVRLQRLRDDTRTRALEFTTAEKPKTRPGAYLWQIVRLAHRTQYLYLHHGQEEVHDWCDGLVYCMYSHFLCSDAKMLVHCPRIVTKLIGNEWHERLALRVEVLDKEEIARRQSRRSSVLLAASLGIEGTTVTSYYIEKPSLSFVELQDRMHEVLHDSIDKGTAKVHWHYVTLKFLWDRHYFKAQERTSVSPTNELAQEFMRSVTPGTSTPATPAPSDIAPIDTTTPTFPEPEPFRTHLDIVFTPASPVRSLSPIALARKQRGSIDSQ